jgi:NAD(P)-dependent dehydrogenase (short-subunit alcohol dehydrogenase family)
VRFLHLDVDKPETHEAARQFIEENFGKLEVLVNNAAIAIDEFKGETLVPTKRNTA